MKLSLKTIEEPSKQIEFLYIAGSLKRKDPIEEAIKQLNNFTKFVGIVDENERLYGGFGLDNHEVHVAVNKKIKGKWTFLLPQMVDIVVDEFGFLTWFYDTKDKEEDKWNTHLIKHLSKDYKVEKIKEDGNTHFYKLRKV
jgi:hypothetical protein|tara:strand:- start:1196 stop:1615 length:420 start_codon:yes stop_codon:yes gene_type:complete